MGTNYYLYRRGASGRQHIGKRSVGRAFHFRGYCRCATAKGEEPPELKIYPCSFADWKIYFFDTAYRVEDENGAQIEPAEFVERVEKWRSDEPCGIVDECGDSFSFAEFC